jgi:hypothetical protein
MSVPVNYNYAIAVTTSDTVNLLPGLTNAIYVGGAGNVVAVLENGDTVLFTAVPVGSVLPIRVKRINATLTTATALVALYVK